MEFKNIVVLGAGTMGHAIAMLFAKGGHSVTLADIRKDALDTARAHMMVLAETLAEVGGEPASTMMSRLTFTTKGLEAVPCADMVVEAVLENEDIKRALYAELEPLMKENTVLASNTSVLNVFELSSPALLRRMVMAHYFVPTHIIPLVEIVGHPSNPPDLVPRLVACLQDVGMAPVVLRKFARGFIINRIQRAINQELFQLVEDGIADVAAIDTAITNCLGMRLGIMSYFSRLDFSGLDLVLNNYRQETLGLVTDETPPALMEKLVARGDLGFKTGRGFYDYTGFDPQKILYERDARLLTMRKYIEKVNALIPATEYPQNADVLQPPTPR